MTDVALGVCQSHNFQFRLDVCTHDVRKLHVNLSVGASLEELRRVLKHLEFEQVVAIDCEAGGLGW